MSRDNSSVREILFRAKRIDNGELVEGFYFCMVHDDGSHVHHFVMPLGVDLSLGTPIEKIQVEVDPKTVCQYTGLTDKNGRKIFEGDILSGLRYHDWGQGGEYKPDKCIIKWDENRAAFDPVYWWEGYNHDLKDYEVIGNIFDNPESIKAKR